MSYIEARLGLFRSVNYCKMKSTTANWSTCMKQPPKLVPLHLYYLYVQTGKTSEALLTDLSEEKEKRSPLVSSKENLPSFR